MKNTFFITGTDTEVGKTFVSCLLLDAFNAKQYKTFGMKPIASGCEADASGTLKNRDALLLQQHASLKKNYQTVNPIALEAAIAPHIAAEKMGLNFNTTQVEQVILKHLPKDADICLIEGAGGWLLPLNQETLFSEVIQRLGLPVILVIGLKLGCLNHALLTYHALRAQKQEVIGWIGNCITPEMPAREENINTLKQHIKAPCLGIIPHATKTPTHIDLEIIKTSLSFKKTCIP